MLRPSPNHGTQRLPNDDDDDNGITTNSRFGIRRDHVLSINNLFTFRQENGSHRIVGTV